MNAEQDGPESAQHEIGMWFTEVRGGRMAQDKDTCISHEGTALPRLRHNERSRVLPYSRRATVLFEPRLAYRPRCPACRVVFLSVTGRVLCVGPQFGRVDRRRQLSLTSIFSAPERAFGGGHTADERFIALFRVFGEDPTLFASTSRFCREITRCSSRSNAFAQSLQ